MGEQNRTRTALSADDPAVARAWDLHGTLPHTLPAADIIALNTPKADLHTWRTYGYRDWTFDMPPGVFTPGETSRMIHDRILDGTIPVGGRSYAAMGAGLGVEAVVAGLRGAKEIHAVDIDPESVRAMTEAYERIVGDRPGTLFHPWVSDLFESVPDGAQFDVITFNPPAVRETVSEDPAVVRNVCVGIGIVRQFFDQIVQRDLLAVDGEIYFIVSNTSELRNIIAYAIESGFLPEVIHHQTWDTDEVQTFLFKLRRNAAV
ncbi:release factor glutamine methyltransferase [Streptomyces sp. WMMB 714]|uniref:methyltransferase n=1 Tax=Streptomyces sp. WMMB 714 TaxID=1286822 RepID=UPI000823F855|nr:methyltransferase [Streptomyces sp. WMMB 714]SCK39275.1 release factor glutamine methyltransferase [Streptomyces sp. WMMB 714]